MKGLKTLAALALMLSAAVSLRAEIRLPAFFADNMVLQQQTQANPESNETGSYSTITI